MIKLLSFLLDVLLVSAPFLLLVLLSAKMNLKKEQRSRQCYMPIIALIFCIVAGVFLSKINALIVNVFNQITTWLTYGADWIAGLLEGRFEDFAYKIREIVPKLEEFIKSLNIPFWAGIIANTLVAIVYVPFKGIIIRFMKLFCKEGKKHYDWFAGLVYYKDERRGKMFVREAFSQGVTLMKTLYIVTFVFAVAGIGITAWMYTHELIASMYYPIFSLILVGEIYFYLNGPFYAEDKGTIEGEADSSSSICDYTLMRNVLRRTFGDKLLSENTTVNNGLLHYRTNDELIGNLEDDDEVAIEAYGKFMRHKTMQGLDVDQNYLMSGLDLLKGKSILFNNPFYYDLIPYIFYPMNRAILRRKKVLVVCGRHAIEDGVEEWLRDGLTSVCHIPTLWNIGVLGDEEKNLDVGIVTRSCVHDLKMHEANEEFFKDVEFVVIIEPSRLVATAQIGLNSLVRHCRRDGKRLVFCSADKNCDGIVDALSHILMTSLEEVSATNRHGGTSSYMCWEVDDEHLQHRMLPNLSRYLGVGTELSFTALKNQVSKTAWYGGEAFPVLDMHWIVKQYHYDLLTYAALPAQQNIVDDVFKATPNMWDAEAEDYNYITVEDESYNMFEVKREFSTRAKKQGFINVISSEYLLKDYMSANDTIFNADSKAIPYIVADYAGTERNVIYRLCLRLSSYNVLEDEIARELSLIDMDTENIASTIWQSICKCSQNAGIATVDGEDELHIMKNGREYVFGPSVIDVQRKYSYKTGNIENMYSISDKRFVDVFLGDLCSAEYIAEDEKGEKQYLGTELRGHVFQKYLPGQFFTFGGKYYEMLRLSSDGKVIVRRAADHINGRPQYRQVRNYTISSAVDSTMMGDMRDIGGVKVTKQYADIAVETPAYWSMKRYNDFSTGKCIQINGVPKREYSNKQMLKIEFTEGEGITPKILNTIALLMNEVFRTLYADNQGMIVAVTANEAEVPVTYSLKGEGEYQPSANAIYIIEDSQLDIGLLVSVERNLNRIFTIIHDYIEWHNETLAESMSPPPVEPEKPDYTVPEEEKKKKGIKGFFAAIGRFFKKIGGFFKKMFRGIGNFFRKLFGRKPKTDDEPAKDGAAGATEQTDGNTGDKPKREGFFKRLFKRKKKKDKDADVDSTVTTPTGENGEELPFDVSDIDDEELTEGDKPSAEASSDDGDLPFDVSDIDDEELNTPESAENTDSSATEDEDDGELDANASISMYSFFGFGKKKKKDEAEPAADSEPSDEGESAPEPQPMPEDDPDYGEGLDGVDVPEGAPQGEGIAAQFEFEADGSKLVNSKEFARKPYHERYYLLYGGTDMPESIDIDGTLALLTSLGYANGFLEQARKGKHEAERLEGSYDPTRSGNHYCDFCGTELLGTEYEVLADGRERCISCSRTAVKTEKEFKQLYEDVMRNMKVFYGVVINEPVQIKMVNAKTLHRKLGKRFVPTGNSDGRVLGVAIKDKEGYSILLENGSPRISATMTMVHEMTHIWQYLNWDAKKIKKLYGKKLNLEIYEGMAKWSEVQYAYLINEFATGKREEIISRMREDEYGRGFNMYTSVYPLSTTTSLKGATPFEDPEKPL